MQSFLFSHLLSFTMFYLHLCDLGFHKANFSCVEVVGDNFSQTSVCVLKNIVESIFIYHLNWSKLNGFQKKKWLWPNHNFIHEFDVFWFLSPTLLYFPLSLVNTFLPCKSLMVKYVFLFYPMTHGVWPGLSLWTRVHWRWVDSPMGIRLKEMTAVPQNPPVANSWRGMGRAPWAPPWSMIDCQPQLLWGHDWWLWHAWNVAYRSLASNLSASCSTMLPEP